MAIKIFVSAFLFGIGNTDYPIIYEWQYNYTEGKIKQHE